MILKNKEIRAVAYNNYKEFGQFAVLPTILFDYKLRKTNNKPNKVFIISLAFLIFRAEISLELYNKNNGN